MWDHDQDGGFAGTNAQIVSRPIAAFALERSSEYRDESLNSRILSEILRRDTAFLSSRRHVY